VFSPRMIDLDHTAISMSIPEGDFFSSLLEEHGGTMKATEASALDVKDDAERRSARTRRAR